MSARDEILERNLRRLFTRSYRPVVPAAEFRARLSLALERARQSSAPARPVAGSRRLAPRLLAAAAVVLALASAWLAWRARDARVETRQEIVARGFVAVNRGAEAAWRALSAAEAARGLDLAASDTVTVQTPANTGIRVRHGSSAVVAIEPASSAAIDVAPERDQRVRLEAGGVRIDNLAAREAWRLGDWADVTLVRGSLSARVVVCDPPRASPCVFVLLHGGEARAGTHALHTGVEVALHGDTIVSATLSAPDATAATRTSVAATTERAADAPAVPPAPVASLAGVIARSETDPALGAYTVTLLRRERLPAISEPRAYAFDGAERFTIRPVKPGTYDVFVEIRGRATWSARGIEIAAGEAREIAVAPLGGAPLEGRVVADATNQPVENALVLLEDLVPAQVIPFASDEPLRAAARTDASGAFRIDHVPPGPHVVRATAPGFGAAWTTLAGGEPQSALELRLGVPGRLAGRVAHDDGRPWRGAIVIASFMRPTGELDRFSYGIAFAEADGSYAIADLPAGDYVLLNVSDNAPGSEATASRQVHVSAGRTTTANLPEAIDGPRFTGRVLDAGGQPLAGLDVTLQPRGADGPAKWRSQRSDAAGAFTFTGLPSAVYDVFVGESLGERFVWIEEITVPPGGALTHDVQVGAGRIRGRATSPHAAIGGSFVVLLRAERDQLVFAGRVRTDAEGVFEFERLVPATYRAIVYPEQKGLAPQASGDLWVARGGPLVECTLAVERGASLAVVVRDAQGVGLHGVALAFRDAAGQAFQFSQADVTGVDGRFAAYNLAAGRWTVTARTAGGATTTRDIELLVGDERELVLTLP